MRPTIHEYLMELAHAASKRSTCDRKHVGCVLAREGHVLATGYNGSLAGLDHCDDVGHDLVTLADGSVNCVRTIHSEQNCVAQAALHGVSLRGATAYTNTFPCWNCFKVLAQAGIREVIYDAEYRKDARVQTAASKMGIHLWNYNERLREEKLGYVEHEPIVKA